MANPLKILTALSASSGVAVSGSDGLKVQQGGLTIDSGDLKLSSTGLIKNSSGTTVITVDGSGNTTVNGALKLGDDRIRGSAGADLIITTNDQVKINSGGLQVTGSTTTSGSLTVGGNGIISGNGSGLTNLSASQLTNFASDVQAAIGGAAITSVVAGDGIAVSTVGGASTVSLTASVAGSGLAYSSGVLSVGVDNSTVEINSDQLRIKDSGVTNAKLANSSLTVTAGDGLTGGGLVALGGSTTVSLSSSVAGNGLGFSSGVLSVNVDDSTVEINGDSLRVKDGGITNAKLTNSSIALGTTAIALGATGSAITGLTSLSATSLTGALQGNASTATTLATTRDISLGGDVTAVTQSFNGSSNIVFDVQLGAGVVGATELASGVAGDGLTGGAGTALAVGAGTGIVVTADSVAVSGASGLSSNKLSKWSGTGFVDSAIIDSGSGAVTVGASLTVGNNAHNGQITIKNTSDATVFSVGTDGTVSGALNAFFGGNITVAGTASIGVLNYLSSSAVQLGEKFIILMSGSTEHTSLDGGGILWGSGSGDTNHASILYRSSIDKLEIYPGISSSAITASDLHVNTRAEFDGKVLAKTTDTFTYLTSSSETVNGSAFQNVSGALKVLDTQISASNAARVSLSSSVSSSLEGYAQLAGATFTGAVTASSFSIASASLTDTTFGNFLEATSGTGSVLALKGHETEAFVALGLADVPGGQKSALEIYGSASVHIHGEGVGNALSGIELNSGNRISATALEGTLFTVNNHNSMVVGDKDTIGTIVENKFGINTNSKPVPNAFSTSSVNAGSGLGGTYSNVVDVADALWGLDSTLNAVSSALGSIGSENNAAAYYTRSPFIYKDGLNLPITGAVLSSGSSTAYAAAGEASITGPGGPVTLNVAALHGESVLLDAGDFGLVIQASGSLGAGGITLHAAGDNETITLTGSAGSVTLADLVSAVASAGGAAKVTTSAYYAARNVGVAHNNSGSTSDVIFHFKENPAAPEGQFSGENWGFHRVTGLSGSSEGECLANLGYASIDVMTRENGATNWTNDLVSVKVEASSSSGTWYPKITVSAPALIRSDETKIRLIIVNESQSAVG